MTNLETRGKVLGHTDDSGVMTRKRNVSGVSTRTSNPRLLDLGDLERGGDVATATPTLRRSNHLQKPRDPCGGLRETYSLAMSH